MEFLLNRRAKRVPFFEAVAVSGYGVFFLNDTATTEIYTLSLHDALPISSRLRTVPLVSPAQRSLLAYALQFAMGRDGKRSEEHTSELQSRPHLVCRLLLEKKKTNSHPIKFLNEKKEIQAVCG